MFENFKYALNTNLSNYKNGKHTINNLSSYYGSYNFHAFVTKGLKSFKQPS